MPGLILEGGTFRPIFSSGLMDALLEHNIMFDYVIGVSAGISDGVSYVSRQKGRNLEIIMKYRRDKRYIGAGNYLKCRSLFGLDFVYGEIPDTLVPFDWETYLQYAGKVVVGVTNARTGEAEYLDGMRMDRKFTMLRATCALPMVFPPILLNGQEYYDGGLRDPIPIRKALADGMEKNLIVLTRQKGYQKELSRENKLAARLLGKKYPKLVEPLLTRHTAYNETVKFCEELAESGKAVLVRPKGPLDSFEKDLEKIKAAYREGYELAEERLEEIKALFS